MQAVLAYVAEILAIVLQVLGITQSLQNDLKNVARETAPKLIETGVSDTIRYVQSLTQGLPDIRAHQATHDDRLDTIDLNIFGVQTQCETIISDIAAIPGGIDYTETLQAILDAIAAIPVPSGWPSASEVADDVWGRELLGDATSGELLSLAGQVANLSSDWQAFLLAANPYFTLSGPWQWLYGNDLDVHTPAPDWADIGADETILAWLQRTDTANTWIADFETGTPMAHADVEGEDGYQFILRPAFISFPPRPGQLPPPGGGAAAVGPPVWPGVAGVTLGSTVPLTSQLELSGPMHGAILNITTPPTKTGLRMIGGHPYDYNVGEVAFVSDRGDIEPWQYIGFRQALFTPKTMASASAALFRILAGAEGTARTFEITE